MGLALLFAVILSILAHVQGYAICGDTVNNGRVNEAVEKVIDRLMELRQADWGWKDTALVVIGLQVAAPQRFFARSKTIKTWRAQIKEEAAKMSLSELALTGIALKSACANPRRVQGLNLIEMLKNRMDKQFRMGSVEPVDGYVAFTDSVEALCVNGEQVRSYYVNKLLEGQNANGSFGIEQSVGDTAKIVLALQCLVRKGGKPDYNLSRVRGAVRAARQFLKLSARKIDGKTTLGDTLESTDALLALWNDMPKSDTILQWKCRAVMKSLGFRHKRYESDEKELVYRLARFRAASVLKLLDISYGCGKSDRNPPGYKPVCNHDIPKTCNPPDDEDE